MEGFDDSDLFRRVIRRLDEQLPQQQAEAPIEGMYADSQAGDEPITPPPVEDYGLGIFDNNRLPVPAPERLPARREASSNAALKTRVGVMALVFTVACGAIAEGVHLAKNDNASAAVGGHHGKHHNKNHSNHQGTSKGSESSGKQTESNNSTGDSSAQNTAPAVSAAPNAHPSKIKSYVLNVPSSQSATPSEAPSPTPTSTASPTQKPAGNAGNGGAAFNFKIATQNQKNHLSNAAHLAALKLIFKHHVDIVGEQEDGWKRYHFSRPILAKHNYGVFPKTHYKGWDQLCSRDVAIYYNKDKFTPVKHEFVRFPQYPLPAVQNCGPGESAKAGRANAPIVWFKENKTGREIIVMNTHNIANVKMAGNSHPARIRYRAAKIYMDKIKQLQQDYPDVPIFLTGDMNEGTGVRKSHNVTLDRDPHKLLSHMMKNTSLMKDASCMNRACQYHTIGGVDFIYGSPGTKVKSFNRIPVGRSHSDHPFVSSTVRVPRNYARLAKNR